jgi:hypothetical protein
MPNFSVPALFPELSGIFSEGANEGIGCADVLSTM